MAVALLTPVCLAQEEPMGGKNHGTPDYCSVSKILGAKVAMNPGLEAKREAEKEGDTAKRPQGKIDDVLVDAHNGELHYAVISFGGFVGIGDKSVAVPCSALRWNEAQERFELDASEDRLKALPAFDLSKARKSGLDAACESVHVHWVAAGATKDKPEKGEAKEASAPKPKEEKMPEAKAVAGTKFFIIPARLACVTEIDDLPVYATTEKFGSISDLIVDRNARTLALAVVKRGGALGLGGTEYLIPFRSIHVCSSGEERVLCMPRDANRMETAVVYEKPKNGIVDADAAKRALAHSDKDGVDNEPEKRR